MGRLIDGLLELSHVTRAGIRYEMIDLSGLVESIAEELKRSDLERRVQFVIEKGLSAEVDRRLLRVALENLLSDGWKFTEERARIEFGAGKQEDEPAFFVRDGGIGFDMAYADKLFGASHRLHCRDEFEGRYGNRSRDGGAYRATSRGQIWAEGEVQRGTTIYFTL